MWRLPYNCVLFTIWGLKLCSLKLPYLLRMCSFPRIVRKVMEFDFFGHGKSWKVMEFELPKRVWTLRDGDVLDSTARPAIAHGLRSRTACDRARPTLHIAAVVPKQPRKSALPLSLWLAPIVFHTAFLPTIVSNLFFFPSGKSTPLINGHMLTLSLSRWQMNRKRTTWPANEWRNARC